MMLFMEWSGADIASLAGAVIAAIGALSARRNRIDAERAATEARKLQEDAVKAQQSASKAHRKMARQAGIEGARLAGKLYVELEDSETLLIINPTQSVIDHLAIECEFISNGCTFEKWLVPLEPTRISLTPPEHRKIGESEFDKVCLEWADKQGNRHTQWFRFIDDVRL